MPEGALRASLARRTWTYAAPAAVVAEYHTIDVSLRAPADHGRHSGHSVLRGALS